MDFSNVDDIVKYIKKFDKINFINGSTFTKHPDNNFHAILKNLPSKEMIDKMSKIGWYFVENQCSYGSSCSFGKQKKCCKDAHDSSFVGIWVKNKQKEEEQIKQPIYYQKNYFEKNSYSQNNYQNYESNQKFEIAPQLFPVSICLPVSEQPNIESPLKESYASKVVASIKETSLPKSTDEKDLTKIDNAIETLQNILTELNDTDFDKDKIELVKQLYEELNKKKKEKENNEKAEKEKAEKEEKIKKEKMFMSKLQEIANIHQLKTFSKTNETIIIEPTKIIETKIIETKIIETKIDETKIDETKIIETKIDEKKINETKINKKATSSWADDDGSSDEEEIKEEVDE